MASKATKRGPAVQVPKCPHGYFVTNATTNASAQCWNVECRWNG